MACTLRSHLSSPRRGKRTSRKRTLRPSCFKKVEEPVRSEQPREERGAAAGRLMRVPTAVAATSHHLPLPFPSFPQLLQ